MSVTPTVALLLILTFTWGMSFGDLGQNMRCRCITKEKKPIGRYIGTVEVNHANSYCKDMEIVATLRKNGQKICLDPDSQWVKRVLQMKKAQQIALAKNVTRSG